MKLRGLSREWPSVITNLLVGEGVGEGADHVAFVLDAEIGAPLLEDALLPAQVLVLKRERLRRHFGVVCLNVNLILVMRLAETFLLSLETPSKAINYNTAAAK